MKKRMKPVRRWAIATPDTATAEPGMWSVPSCPVRGTLPVFSLESIAELCREQLRESCPDWTHVRVVEIVISEAPKRRKRGGRGK